VCFLAAWPLPLFPQLARKNKNYCQPKGSKGGFRNERNWKICECRFDIAIAGALMAPGSGGGPLTTRKKGASIGALGGIEES